MSNEKLGSKDLPKHNSAKEEKIEHGGEDKAVDDLLTDTAGSPSVPTAEGMAESPNADGQDGRIGLKEEQKPKDASDASKKK